AEISGPDEGGLIGGNVFRPGGADASFVFTKAGRLTSLYVNGVVAVQLRIAWSLISLASAIFSISFASNEYDCGRIGQIKSHQNNPVCCKKASGTIHPKLDNAAPACIYFK